MGTVLSLQKAGKTPPKDWLKDLSPGHGFLACDNRSVPVWYLTCHILDTTFEGAYLLKVLDRYATYTSFVNTQGFSEQYDLIEVLQAPQEKEQET